MNNYCHDANGRFTGRGPVRHGMFMQAPLGQLSRQFATVNKAVIAFRRAVETALADSNGGEVNIYQAKLVRTACKAFRSAECGERLKRKLGAPPDGLSLEQFLSIEDRILKWESQCDSILRILGLDKKQDESLADVFGMLSSLSDSHAEIEGQADSQAISGQAGLVSDPSTSGSLQSDSNLGETNESPKATSRPDGAA